MRREVCNTGGAPVLCHSSIIHYYPVGEAIQAKTCYSRHSHILYDRRRFTYRENPLKDNNIIFLNVVLEGCTESIEGIDCLGGFFRSTVVQVTENRRRAQSKIDFVITRPPLQQHPSYRMTKIGSNKRVSGRRDGATHAPTPPVRLNLILAS